LPASCRSNHGLSLASAIAHIAAAPHCHVNASELDELLARLPAEAAEYRLAHSDAPLRRRPTPENRQRWRLRYGACRIEHGITQGGGEAGREHQRSDRLAGLTFQEGRSAFE